MDDHDVATDNPLASRPAVQRMQSYRDTYNDAAIAAALRESELEEDYARQGALVLTASRDRELAARLQEQEFLQVTQEPPAPSAPSPPPGGTPPKPLKRQSLTHNPLTRGLVKTIGKAIPLIPRVNSSLVPGAADVSDDRQRLLCRLDMYGLAERTVTGDGNCQFRAVADQLYADQSQHMAVRAAVVHQLLANPQRYAVFVPQEYGSYVHQMQQSGTWGDHVTLQAAADAYGVRICILTSFLSDAVISIDPMVLRSEDDLWLAFWAEVHYNSIVPRQPTPPSKSSSGKKLANAFRSLSPF